MFVVTAFYFALQVALARSQCVDSFLQVGNPVQGVRTETPVTWMEIDALCTRTYPGYKLMQIYDTLSSEQEAFCGDHLVPFGVYEFYDAIYWAQSFGISMRLLTDTELRSMDRSFPIPTFGNGVLNLTTRLWHLTEEDVVYQCALCQAERSLNVNHYPLYPVTEPLAAWHNRYDIKLVGDNASITQLNEEFKLELGKEVSKVLNITDNAIFRRLKINNKGLVELHYRLDVYRMHDGVCRMSMKILGKFEMTLTDVSECPEESVVGYSGGEERLPSTALGSIHVTINTSTSICSRRECTWNSSPEVDRPEWSPPTYWTIQFTPCTDKQQYNNDNTFGHLLGATIHEKYLNRLKTLANSTVNEADLDEVIKIASREMMRRNIISQDMSTEVTNILAHVVLDDDNDNCMKEENRMHIIVVDLKGEEHPAIGFALPLVEEVAVGAKHKTGYDRVRPELESNISEEVVRRSQFVAAVSEELVERGCRLAFAVDLKDVSKEVKSWTYEKAKVHDIEVTIVLKLKNNTARLMLDNVEFYVEIMYQTLPIRHDITFKSVCAAWTVQTNWTTKGCKPVAVNAAVEGCRCSAKYFTLSHGVLSGLYGLKNNHSDAKRQDVFTFTADHPVLMAAMLLNAFFAIVSLLLIILTSFFFNVWIINGDNKVMLQMTVALFSNLVLSVTASFVEFDTESAGCTALGASRHYTLLAMFLWLLVMSSTQVNRLMTEQSGKTTSQTVLKFTLFAWGVPLGPIGLLLLSNPRLYAFDRFDRGYCYPDGVSFELTVFAPVGFILLITLGIFVVTVTHVFEFGAKTKKILSGSERLEQVRHLRRSVTVYLVFCLILALHFLSEMRAVRDDFMFEYLQLLTMMGLVTVFAVFYVCLEDYVLMFWKDSCKKLRFQITCSKET